jgi:FHS family L-fucose permease-like MFS transporter
MAIVGGAVLPLIFGYIADQTGSLQFGHLVSLFCFVIVLIFAIKGHKIVKNEI